jgi:hypothetical protein
MISRFTILTMAAHLVCGIAVAAPLREPARAQDAGDDWPEVTTFQVPNFNPIEQAFAKTKQALRRVGARTWEGVCAAVSDALTTITAADARAFFAAAGFPLTVQSVCMLL